MLSEYEQKRLETVRRNNAKLRQLGLISEWEEKSSNALAAGTVLNYDVKTKKSKNDDNDDDDEEYSEESSDESDTDDQPNEKAKRRRTAHNASTQSSRKSRRLQGLSAGPGLGIQHENDNTHPSTRNLREEREQRVLECRAARLRAANAWASEGKDTKNPTATYEHCLMRVQSMTHKGLANRIKAIERAAGQHCIIKMAIFKACLQDEGIWDLADLAGEALERLKTLQPIPEDDDGKKKKKQTK